MNRHNFHRILTLSLTVLVSACAPSADSQPENISQQIDALTRSGSIGGKTIAAGVSHVCAIREGGQVYCWGLNSSRQLGQSDTTDRYTPVQVSGVSNAVEVVAGYSHTCARLADSTVRCWGQGSSGQLGNGTTASTGVPTAVGDGAGGTLQNVISLGTGTSANHTCAVLADGTAKCWGAGSNGQLGNGATANKLYPVSVTGLGNVREIVTGAQHTCARTAIGEGYCWGSRSLGRLGDGLTTGQVSAPQLVPGLAPIAQLAAGYESTCALRLDSTGTIPYCWGNNNFKQLGLASGASTASVPTAVRWDLVPSGKQAVALQVGYHHACAKLSTGESTCWGEDDEGQSGMISTATVSYPQGLVAYAVGTALPGVTEMALGHQSSCAMTQAGEVWCWGKDGSGQLGDGAGATPNTYLAVKVAFPAGVTVSNHPVFTAGIKHSCTLSASGQVKCSGDNSWAQLGNDTWTSSTTPVSVVSATGSTSPLTGVTVLDSHASHTCAVLASGGVRCWGRGDSGQNGQGVRAHALAPVAPVGLDGATLRAVSVATGGSHGCALLSDGKVQCWGANVYGQLGSGDALDVFPSPRDVKYADGTALTGVTQLAAGQLHTCALTADGKVRCWGYNTRGETGNGAPCLAVPNPITVQDAGSDLIAVELVTGSEHTCARQASGRVLCWGYNSHGPVGDGTVNSSSVPVETMASGATALLAGDYHSCAIKSDGKLYCWGYNADGQLGDGTTTDKLSPTQVTGLPSGVYPVSMGGSDGYTCVVLSDNSTRCWGANADGQFGNGTTISSTTPVAAASL